MKNLDFPTYADAYFDLRYRSGEIAFHTWKSARSHVRGFARFLRETGRTGSLPLSEVGPGILQGVHNLDSSIERGYAGLSIFWALEA